MPNAISTARQRRRALQIRTFFVGRDAPGSPVFEFRGSILLDWGIAMAKKQKKPYRLLQAGAALAAVAGVFVAAWGILGPVRFSGWKDAWRLTGRQGDGFPLPYSYASLQQAALVGSSLALLGPTALQVRTRGSYEAMEAPLLFHSPALRAQGGRMLLFDRDSNHLLLLSKTETLHKLELEHDIYCVDLNRTGAFAVATKAENFASEIQAYGAKKNLRFRWRCEKEYPAALRLSAGGRALAICLVGTEQAQVYARFVEFAFEREDPRIDLRLDGAWLYGAAEIDGGWLAVGDQAVYLILRGAAQPTAFSYEGRALAGFASDEKHCAVLLQDWDNHALLRVYDREGALCAEQRFRDLPAGVQCAKGAVYLRFADCLLRWRQTRVQPAEFRQSAALPAGTQDAFVTGGQAYVLTLRTVDLIKLKWSEVEDGLLGVRS